MKKFGVGVLIFLSAQMSMADQCRFLHAPARVGTPAELAETVEHEVLKACKTTACAPKTLTHAIAKGYEKFLNKSRTGIRNVAAFSVILGVVWSANQASGYLANQVLHDYPTWARIVGQGSMMVFFFVGAPLFQPLKTVMTKWNNNILGMAQNALNKDLEFLWKSTQKNYSINAQLARTTLMQFHISAHQHLMAAREAQLNNDPSYAATQVALIAQRLRTLFGEISPQDKSMAQAIRDTLGLQPTEYANLKQNTLEKLRESDPDFLKPEVQKYYDQLFAIWF